MIRAGRALALGITILALGQAECRAADPGQGIYDQYCALCHQRGAAGLAGQFPRLSGRVGKIAARPAGRKYLIEVVLNGMAGRISVDGARILGVMPSFRTLSDEQIAAVLSYVAGLPGKAPERRARIRPEQVASRRRAPQLPPTTMAKIRGELQQSGGLP